MDQIGSFAESRPTLRIEPRFHHPFARGATIDNSEKSELVKNSQTFFSAAARPFFRKHRSIEGDSFLAAEEAIRRQRRGGNLAHFSKGAKNRRGIHSCKQKRQFGNKWEFSKFSRGEARKPHFRSKFCTFFSATFAMRPLMC